jgi:XTP/dITP diphosphohydrolase
LIAIAIPEVLWNQTARRLNVREQAPRIQIFEGICEGEIIPEERGTGGFGYDPIFLVPELGKTMAELSMDEKNRLSHRARAVIKAKGILQELFG